MKKKRGEEVDEQQKKNLNKDMKSVAKGLMKSSLRKLIIFVVIFVAVVIFFGGGVYVIKKDDFKKVSETKETYSTTVNNQGQVTYTKNEKEEDGTIVKLTPAEMAEEYKDVLKRYISEDDEEYAEVMQYLMGAETVTTMPYFDNLSEGELNGRIKFYRYTDSEDEVNGQDVTEESRLKFKPLEEFNAKLEAYKTNASANRDIFNYFTMDEEGTVLVAYGSEEYRKITTGVDGGAKDKDLTAERVKESSTFEGNYSGNYNTEFSASHFTIDTKPIDYRSLVEQYTMPSTLLYAFLIQTENIEFVKALANLAYETEISIGIYDNKYYSETSELYTYKKLFKMKVETELEYLDMLVSITDSQPSIVLKETDLSSSPYQYIPISCKVETADNGQIKHIKTFKKEGQNTWTLTPSKMFIGGTNNNNQITSLGEGETYKTKYTKTINSMSTPTVGVLLADTWIAKWEATYSKEITPSQDYPEGPTEIEDKEITAYTFDKVLNAFDQNLGSNISNKLTEHAEAMRTDAINKIITTAESISPSIFEVEVESVKFSDSEKREVFKKHVLECNDGRAWSQDCGYERDCWDYISHYYPWIVKNQSIETVFSSVENIDTFIGYVNSGPLTSTTVKQHFDTEWNKYKKQKTQSSEQVANNQEKARKDEFKRQLKKDGAIEYYQTYSGSKHYVDTTYTYSSSASSSRYNKSEEIQRTEVGKKFSEVFNRDEFHSTRTIFDEIELWFWEYIRIDKDTEKIGDILRYLLNIATNSKQFGTFTEEDIEALFSAFEPKEEMAKVSTDSSIKLFQKYVRMYENSYIFDYVYGISDNYTNVVSKYITQDRTAYYVRTDGGKNPTVGFGVDLFNGGFKDELFGGEISPARYLIEYYGYTEEQLRDTSGKTTIPTEIVDELELKELQKHIDDKMKMNTQENLGLTKYQIYALASLGFNTGRMYQWGNFGFEQLYKENWNQEKDDKYGEDSCDYEHKLYTDFFYKHRYSDGGKENPGLIKRRKSEWTLFQTGYMDMLGKWVSDQDYPEGIRLFTMDGTGLTFPEYPQDHRGGEQYVLYKDKGMGGKTYEQYGRTLETSGCGIFAASCITSGLLGDASIDPISYVENLDKYFPKGDYYYYKPFSDNNGGNDNIWNNKFLEKYYGLNSMGCSSEAEMKKIFEQKKGNCGAIINEGGHYVAIIPIINANGKCESFFAIDSVGKNTGEYTSASEYISKNHRKNARFTIMGIIY